MRKGCDGEKKRLMIIVATTSLPVVDRRPLERRMLVPILEFSLVPAYFCCGWVKSPICRSFVNFVQNNTFWISWYLRINNQVRLVLSFLLCSYWLPSSTALVFSWIIIHIAPQFKERMVSASYPPHWWLAIGHWNSNHRVLLAKQRTVFVPQPIRSDAMAYSTVKPPEAPHRKTPIQVLAVILTARPALTTNY